MRAFNDNSGRTWEVDLTVASGKRVRALTGVDLFKILDNGMKPLGNLLGDVCQLVDVVFAMVKEQADAAGVTDEEFGRSLGGDSLANMADAFREAIADFCPDPAARRTLRDAWNKAEQLGRVLVNRAATKLAAMDLDRMADGLLAESSSGATTSPVPSGSTPGR